MVIHKGELVEKAVRENGFPITLLAQRMGKSRRHIYHLFENPNISLDVILQIGKIIQHDFRAELKELINIPEEVIADMANEPIASFESKDYWKSKYYELLEQHTSLLKKKLMEYADEIKK